MLEPEREDQQGGAKYQVGSVRRDARLLVELLGFEVVMDLGWVATVASPNDTSAQVNIIGNDDPAAPGISVEVEDVDAVHARRSSEDSRSPTPCATRNGEFDASCFASRVGPLERPLPPHQLTT